MNAVDEIQSPVGDVVFATNEKGALLGLRFRETAVVRLWRRSWSAEIRPPARQVPDDCRARTTQRVLPPVRGVRSTFPWSEEVPDF